MLIRSVEAAESLTRRSGMQRNIMEHAPHAMLLHKGNEGSTSLQIAQFNIEHVRIVLTALGDVGELQKNPSQQGAQMQHNKHAM